jgi:hypothetical protein
MEKRRRRMKTDTCRPCCLCVGDRYVAVANGSADHTGRHVDRRHITDWPRWGSLQNRWTERRLSWCAILFVSRSSIHRARSTWADCGPPVNPISCAARRHICAIENCVSRLQPPLAYCVTEFGRLFVRRLTYAHDMKEFPGVGGCGVPDDLGNGRAEIAADSIDRAQLHRSAVPCRNQVGKTCNRIRLK